MAINIFEGARRISRIAIAIWVITFISFFIYLLVTSTNIWDIELILFASMLFGGLIFIWAFTWTIGWIVRGFMGIPRGQDKK